MALKQGGAKSKLSDRDRWGIGSFLFGLVVFTCLALYATKDFANDVCRALLGEGDAVESIGQKVHEARDLGQGGNDSNWVLNQIGMCLNDDVLLAGATEYPPTLGLALASMLLGLLGGTTALACRFWPEKSRTAPQMMSDAATGGSVGIALFALAGILDARYAAGMGLVLVLFLCLCMWILRCEERWLTITLLTFLILSMLAVLVASLWPSQSAWQNVLAWCMVLGLLAAASVVVASAGSLLRSGKRASSDPRSKARPDDAVEDRSGS